MQPYDEYLQFEFYDFRSCFQFNYRREKLGYVVDSSIPIFFDLYFESLNDKHNFAFSLINGFLEDKEQIKIRMRDHTGDISDINNNGWCIHSWNIIYNMNKNGFNYVNFQNFERFCPTISSDKDIKYIICNRCGKILNKYMVRKSKKLGYNPFSRFEIADNFRKFIGE